MEKLSITNIDLAAMLATCNVPLANYEDNSPPFIKLQTEKGITYHFFFEPTDTAFAVVDNFRNPEAFVAENPDHPQSEILAFIANRKILLDTIKQSKGLIQVQKNGRTAFVSGDASDEIKQEVARRL